MSTSTKLSEYYEGFHAARRKTGTVQVAHRLDYIAAKVGSGKRVIELGCRFGDVLARVVGHNDVVGVDIDRTALAVCRERYGIETSLVDLNGALPYDARSFDVAVMSEVLEHLPYPEITLGEVRRILRPGGRLVGSVPNGRRLRNRLRFLLGGPVELDKTHLHHFSPKSLTALLKTFFNRCEVVPVAGRLVVVNKTLFSNYLLFTCDGPIPAEERL